MTNTTSTTSPSITTPVKQVFEINNYLDFQYLTILNEIKENGVTKGDRTGTGTKSLFGTSIRVDLRDGFPLLTSKKVFTKAVIYELLWFLGKHMLDKKYQEFERTNIKYLVDNGVNIWVGDAFKAYQRNTSVNPFHKDSCDNQDEFIERIKTDDAFAKIYGNLGPVYGEQWTSWYNPDMEPIDQIDNVIHTLKHNPDSRRIMVSAWNVADLDSMVLPPCHYSFQFWTRELTYDERIALMDTVIYQKLVDEGYRREALENALENLNIPKRAISLIWNQRSADYPLGVPFNIASYAFLLHMVAKVVNMVPEELIGNFGDSHIYTNQLEAVDIQSANPTFDLPTLEWNHKKQYDNIYDFDFEDFHIVNYVNAGKVEYPLSN